MINWYSLKPLQSFVAMLLILSFALEGKEDGLGVENLRGSGMIAGETSQAYEEIVTFSMVSCRAIGIGAYLVRLGQRIVQVENSHIILTGFRALNKVRSLLICDLYTRLFFAYVPPNVSV